jgi:hypothetical protein
MKINLILAFPLREQVTRATWELKPSLVRQPHCPFLQICNFNEEDGTPLRACFLTYPHTGDVYTFKIPKTDYQITFESVRTYISEIERQASEITILGKVTQIHAEEAVFLGNTTPIINILFLNNNWKQDWKKNYAFETSPQ